MPYDKYFGQEQIDSSREELYICSEGTIRPILSDYQRRGFFQEKRRAWNAEQQEHDMKMTDLEREYQEARRKIKGLDIPIAEKRKRLALIRTDYEDKKARLLEELNRSEGYWGQRLHKETREPFDESTRYRNPNDHSTFLKDLHLVRRLILPGNPMDLDPVMVGDAEDIDTVRSDPETPLIIISNRVQSGEWLLVETVLDTLFSDDATRAWENFEALYAAARIEARIRTIAIDGITYIIKKGDYGERVVVCP